MRKRILAVAATLCAVAVQALTVQVPSSPIAIDGKLDEALWKRTEVVKIQNANGDGSEVKSKPEFRMAWSDEGLYIAFAGHGGVAVRKGDLWVESDNIEFFLSPGVNKEMYYQFAISSANDIHQAHKVEKPVPVARNDRWRCPGFQSAVTIDENDWYLEFFVPFAGLSEGKAPKPYSIWDGNFISNKCLGNKTKEYSSFSMTMGKNHDPNMWGKFRFLGYGD